VPNYVERPQPSVAQQAVLLEQRDQHRGASSAVAGRQRLLARQRAALNAQGAFLWYVVVPIATSLFGYFPRSRRAQGRRPAARRDAAVATLVPAIRATHVGAEARRLRDASPACAFRLVALSITDDEMMTERGTRVLVDCYAERAARARAHRTRPTCRRGASATSASSGTSSSLPVDAHRCAAAGLSHRRGTA
jgi:hypothetical protein